MLSRFHARALLATAAACIGGCAAIAPDIRTEADAASAAGLIAGDAIVFRDALPDDVTEDIGLLTLDAVVRRVAQHSPDIQSAMARVRIAQAEANQSRLLPNPVMSLALRFPESGSTVIDAGLSADLLAFLRRPGAIHIADSRLRAASADAVTTVLDELADAQERFFTIQSLEATLVVLRERSVLIERLLGLADSRLRAGEGTRLDLVTLQTQKIELDAEIADTELQQRDERLALARRLGQPSAAAEWSLPVLADTHIAAPDEATCIRIALESRPEVQQRTWELAAFGYEQKQTGWNHWAGTEAGIAAERDGEWSIGPAAELPFPLFDMGQAQRQRAIAAVIEARHQLTASRRAVIEDVRRTLATLRASLKNLERVKSQLLPLQEDRLKQAEAQFRAGQSDITGLLVAEQDLRASRALLIDLQRKAAIAQVRLERAVGGAGVLATASHQSTSLPAPLTPSTQRNP